MRLPSEEAEQEEKETREAAAAKEATAEVLPSVRQHQLAAEAAAEGILRQKAELAAVAAEAEGVQFLLAAALLVLAERELREKEAVAVQVQEKATPTLAAEEVAKMEQEAALREERLEALVLALLLQ